MGFKNARLVTGVSCSEDGAEFDLVMHDWKKLTPFQSATPSQRSEAELPRGPDELAPLVVFRRQTIDVRAQRIRGPRTVLSFRSRLVPYAHRHPAQNTTEACALR